MEESELGTVVALNVGGKVVPRNDDLVCVVQRPCGKRVCQRYCAYIGIK